jgi:hypothetical protein
MTEFYKGMFKPILDKWREGERKSARTFVLQYLMRKSDSESGASAQKGKKSSKDAKMLASYKKNNQEKKEFDIIE